MGQHKYNNTAKAAKDGKLPKKKKKTGRRESERLILEEINRITNLDKITKELNAFY